MVEETEILEHGADPPSAASSDRLLLSFAASRPKTRIVPRVGRSESSMSRMRVVLPAPDGPVRN